MNAEDILKSATPEDLFPESSNDGELLYKKLIRQYHPDRAQSDHDRVTRNAVTSHLTMLMRKAREKWMVGDWFVPNRFVYTEGGKQTQVRLLARHPTDYGEVLVGNTFIGYSYNEKNVDLADIAISAAGHKYVTPDPNVVYENPVMRSGTSAGGKVLFYTKEPDELLLKDVISHLTAIEPRTACWIISRLYNITSCLHYNGLVSGGILPENIVVHPAKHTAKLVGGYGFSAKIGSKLHALPAVALQMLPASIKQDKLAVPQIDLELVKFVGRSLLGDPAGNSVLQVAPRPITTFLKSPASNSALSDWETWGKVLDEAYGVRKFVDFRLTADELYREK